MKLLKYIIALVAVTALSYVLMVDNLTAGMIILALLGVTYVFSAWNSLTLIWKAGAALLLASILLAILPFTPLLNMFYGFILLPIAGGGIAIAVLLMLIGFFMGSSDKSNITPA